ncbi:PDZ domain-containing protein [candidate division WOR-3 bacterium]|nr:PDZ domain-containing protein [candidate division WOR-3 bacterium]
MRRGIFYISILVFIPALLMGAQKQGFLGVYLEELSGVTKAAIGVEYGVFVKGIVEGSPAESAGIKAGDVILAINDEKMEDKAGLSNFIKQRPGEEVEFTIFRQGKEIKLKAKFGEKEMPHLGDEMELEDGGVWGGGGGPNVMYFPPKLDDINKELKAATVLGKTFDGGMFLTGGWGCGTVCENLRIGGGGGGGSQVITGKDRKAELSIDYGGFLTEYIIPIGKLQIFLGGMIGGGSIGLKISRASGLSWDEMWDNFNQGDSVSGKYYEADLKAGFLYYQPYIGIQFPVMPWCYLTLQGGYFGTKMYAWKQMGKELTDYPEMNLSNYCITLGVMFGYFTH